jgi:hypothetical protein
MTFDVSQYRAPGIFLLVVFGIILWAGQMFMLTQPWGVIWLNLFAAGMFFCFRPTRLAHPATFVFAFYFLWVVTPSMVDFSFHLLGREYVLYWGRLWDWSALSHYTLLQIQLNMIVVIVTLYLLAGPKISEAIDSKMNESRAYFASIRSLISFQIILWVLVLVFLQSSGGLSKWLENYSHTYLTGRKGLGEINVAIITISTLLICLAGLRNFGRRRGLLGIIPLMPIILATGFVSGFKSRLIILMFFFFLPYLVTIPVTIMRALRYGIGFFALLYVLTLLRSSGFYSGWSGFLELLTTYFNSYPLHDLIVKTQDPGIWETAYQAVAKPLGILGYMDREVSHDLSVMLTKGFFPDQWYRLNATQQWPIETDMYLNFGGILGQWAPMFLYSAYIGILYKLVLHRGDWRLFPIMALEMFRIISVMRGVMIPWMWPMLIIQYSFCYGVMALYLPTRAKSTSPQAQTA